MFNLNYINPHKSYILHLKKKKKTANWGGTASIPSLLNAVPAEAQRKSVSSCRCLTFVAFRGADCDTGDISCDTM